MAARLSPQQIDEALSTLPAWTLVEEGSAIRRELRFAGFDEAMVFIVALAEVARRLDHHADLYNVYDRVTLRLSTHDAGGLTERDFAFAAGAEGVLRSIVS
ncbi:MAG: 4a-hydroxytetrahydrobiopterin dehydratase [Deltaproteobacteria bacterium]|nr:4a-hydroxytetrahydrobiopterin dehydratase [Deltaproteobacteria bacterium]